MKNKSPTLTFESLKPRLTRLGFGFYGEPAAHADPEATLLDAIRLGTHDSKVFKMLLAWLDKTHELMHVERVRTLSTLLSPHELVTLGVVASKQANSGDRRFFILVEHAKKLLKKTPADITRHTLASSDRFLIEKYGLDPDLQAFGVQSPRITPADPKKILTLEKILEQNPWLKFRALIGANYRADIAFLMAGKLAINPYQAAKQAKCSQETAYRLWKGLMLYRNLEALAH